MEREMETPEQYVRRLIAEEVRRSTGGLNLRDYLKRQLVWSTRTFGPGERKAGILDHIRKEMEEVRAAVPGADVEEWIDIVILALDGAWRSLMDIGLQPDAAVDLVMTHLEMKQEKNRARRWPDWRTQTTERAIEHIREES